MAMLDAASGKIGQVGVTTTSGRGLSVEWWAEQALERIVYVADGSGASPISQQAHAFKEQIRAALIHFMKRAIQSDRTTLYNLFIQQGHQDMAEILRRLP